MLFPDFFPGTLPLDRVPQRTKSSSPERVFFSYSSEEKNDWLGIVTCSSQDLFASALSAQHQLHSTRSKSLLCEKQNPLPLNAIPKMHGAFSLRLLCQSFASYFHILFLPRCVWSRPSIPVMRRLMPIINLFILSQFSEQQPSNNSTACSRL